MILRLKKKLINSISLLQWSSYGRFALKSNKNSTLSFIETKSPRIFHVLLLYLQTKFYQNISKGKEKKEKTNKTYTNVKSNARKDGQTDRQTHEHKEAWHWKNRRIFLNQWWQWRGSVLQRLTMRQHEEKRQRQAKK